MLRFRIDFPQHFSRRPPTLTFSSDVFHPLVTPLTTYTHTNGAPDAGTVSSANDRLPPGGFALRHGFPEWFEDGAPDNGTHNSDIVEGIAERSVHIVEVLQYLRIVFDTESVLDDVPLELAANTGAWHAWRTYRSKFTQPRKSLSTRDQDVTSLTGKRSISPRQQPGGARRPGEWNWQGVWEDRVRKSIEASVSEPVLFGGDSEDVVRA